MITLDYEYVQDTSLENPQLYITYADSLDFSFFKYNYLILNPSSALSDFGNRRRCYFVDTEKTYSVSKGSWVVQCNLDALETYKKEILASVANVARSSKEYNLYLNDTFYSAFAYPRIGCKEFPNGFSDTYEFQLNVCNTLGGV